MNQIDSSNYLHVAFYNPQDKDYVEKYKDDIPAEIYIPMLTVPVKEVFVFPFPREKIQFLNQFKDGEINDGTGT